MVDAAVRRFGGLDIVVNNAGTTHRNGKLLDVDEATFDRIYAVNVKSLYWMAQAAVPVLRRQGRGGTIINISSTAGIRPRPGLAWYNGTKGAVNIITQCMATELAPDSIRVNAVCPVLGATGLTELFMGAPDTPEVRAALPRHHPARPHEPARRHRQRLPLARRGRVFVHHRHPPPRGRRPHRLTRQGSADKARIRLTRQGSG